MHTILIIDDEPAIRHILSVLLRKFGYTIVTAESAQEGLALVAQAQPNLIITDFNMPGMTGGDLCQQLKANPLTRHIPAIMYSASLYAERSRERIPADSFVAKPAPPQLILNEVRNLLAA
jgi:CheY-like chemotaxis protein